MAGRVSRWVRAGTTPGGGPAAAALAAYIRAFATTSNLEAARRYGIPSAGTAAHSFTLLHDTERERLYVPVRCPRQGHHVAPWTPTTWPRRSDRDPRSPVPRSARSGRLRRPAVAGRAGPRANWTTRRHEDPDHRDQRPGRVQYRCAAAVDGYGVGTGW